MQGCKCFFIVTRSISTILYCLILVWQQNNVEGGENSLTCDSHRLSKQIVPAFGSLQSVVSTMTHYTTSLNTYCREHPRMCLCFDLARPVRLSSARYAREELQPPALAQECRCYSLARLVPRVQGSVFPVERGTW